MVAPRVYQAMAQPVVGHLDPFFFQVVEEIRTLLGYAFSTKNQFNVALSGTGSAGMEAAVANFIEPGEKFALLTNGFFGDRIGDMARRHGGDVVRLSKPWGEPFDPQEARDFIRRESPRVVAFVQAETSTGLYNQAQPICEAAHEVDALTIADCVTSLGGMPVLVDETGIDIAYSCSQKGLGCPPGLSPITVSPRALDRLKSRQTPVQSFYLDLRLLDTFYTGHKYHHTASATMFYALREGLAIVAEEGLEARWQRHRAKPRGVRRRHRSHGPDHARPRRSPPLDAQHAAHSRRRGRRQSPPVPPRQIQHGNRRRLRTPGRQGLPHRHHGLQFHRRKRAAHPASPRRRPSQRVTPVVI